jgi:5-oxopent-3-ene-1,2,5-tricarboxylate decarboxylase/2-hydroxyhepta-2,4-diene-1,7-dioate isomerase
METDAGPTIMVPMTHGVSAWIDDSVQNPGMSTCGPNLDFPTPPYRLSGVVVGPLLNHAAALAALGGVAHGAPYTSPPKGPILYIKPRNTLAATGDAVAIPWPFEELEIGASLGMVIGSTACRVSEGEALDHVSGYTLVADLSLPHDSFYRPSIRFKALDRSCLIGPRVVSRGRIGEPDALKIRISVDGAEAQIASMSGMIRPAARLIADVSAFMTLRPGDVLMLGVAFGAPRARAGEAFSVDAAGIGRLDGRLEAESDRMIPA